MGAVIFWVCLGVLAILGAVCSLVFTSRELPHKKEAVSSLLGGTCPDCGGEGSVNGYICHGCHGSGRPG